MRRVLVRMWAWVDASVRTVGSAVVQGVMGIVGIAAAVVLVVLSSPCFAQTARWFEVGPNNPTQGHAMVYDTARGEVVSLGGFIVEDGNGTTRSRTWLWNGQSWRRAAADTPPARQLHAMAYDSSRGVVVMFGGSQTGGTNISDTWEWDGVNWTLRTTMGPTARYFAAMSYDAAREVVVLFGGFWRGSMQF